MDYGYKETVRYGVSAYSFLILGQEMDGASFVEVIKKRYDMSNPRTKAVVGALERHLVSIKVRRDGKTEYQTKP